MILLGISTSVQAITCDDFPGFLGAEKRTKMFIDYYVDYLLLSVSILSYDFRTRWGVVKYEYVIHICGYIYTVQFYHFYKEPKILSLDWWANRRSVFSSRERWNISRISIVFLYMYIILFTPPLRTDSTYIHSIFLKTSNDAVSNPTTQMHFDFELCCSKYWTHSFFTYLYLTCNHLAHYFTTLG